MQSVIANLDGVDLQLEYLIYNQTGVQPLPFVGMDSKIRLFWLISKVVFRIGHTNL